MLSDTLESQGIDKHALILTFGNWRAKWPQNEDKNKFFGKEGGYRKPLVDGRPDVLRHVHITPLGDLDERDWMRRFLLRRKRTSDRHLVFVDGKSYGYLLIDILEEPYAHEVAEMNTPEDERVMKNFAKIAEEFLTDGTVIA
jgi:mRNA interferase YafO